MVELHPTSPFSTTFPRDVGGVSFSVHDFASASLVSPFKGKRRAVSAALKSSLGINLPGPNRTTATSKGRAIWMGPEQALVIGVLPDLSGLAAVTEQADAWAVLHLTGPSVVDVLARLVPIDLRPTTFKKGHTARTLVGHMTASITRVNGDTFEVMVMRSMADTLAHELTEAAKGVAARMG